MKSKLVTLVLFNNTGTLQIQGLLSLSLPVHEESVILVLEEDTVIMSELDYLRGEVTNIRAHLKESKQSTGEMEKLQLENNRLRD